MYYSIANASFSSLNQAPTWRENNKCCHTLRKKKNQSVWLNLTDFLQYNSIQFKNKCWNWIISEERFVIEFFSFDSFGVSVWMGKQEANERDWQDYDFLPLLWEPIHIWVSQHTSIPSSPTKWDELLRWPTRMLALSSAGPALLLGMCVSCVGYMSWPLFVHYCACYKWWKCVSDTGQHWAWGSCALLDSHVPVLVRATNDWVWALCSLSSTKASAKFTRIDTGPWGKKQT